MPASSIQQLNDDVLMRIFDYLNYDDKLKLRRTCTRWRYLLERQLKEINTIRLGEFQSGGFQVTSGLQMACREHLNSNRRRQTGTLFNEHLVQCPADLETQTYSINRYDYLHRALKQQATSCLTVLSLGRLQISYRLLMALTTNLPHLEHLELINCASRFETNQIKRLPSASKTSHPQDNQTAFSKQRNTEYPSLESFNSPSFYHSTNIIYNQHQDEEVNLRERLIRSTLIRNCQLIQEARRQNYWSKLKHLLIKDCNLLNEFTLCLILAIASRSLHSLSVESNQYLTGEFLNYCGPQVKSIHLNKCPMIRSKFLEDLAKLKQFLDQKPKLEQHQQRQTIKLDNL